MYIGHCYEGDRARAQDRRHAGLEGHDEAPGLRPLRHTCRRSAAEDGPRSRSLLYVCLFLNFGASYISRLLFLVRFRQVQTLASGGERRGDRHARHRQVPLRRHLEDGEGVGEGQGGDRQRGGWRRQVSLGK